MARPLLVRLIGATAPVLFRLSLLLPRRWGARLIEGSIMLGYREVFERRNWMAASWLVDPEFVLENRGAEATGLPGVYHGIEGLRRYREQVDEAIEEDQFEVLDFRVAAHDRFLLAGRLRWRARHTGLQFDAPWAYVFTLRKGRLLQADSYPNPSRAYQDVGLRERNPAGRLSADVPA